MNQPTLSDITRHMGGTKEVSELLLSALFLRIANFFAAEWLPNMAPDVAALAYSEYHWMTLAEWKLFEVRIKAGAFGRQFHKLSPAELMGHLATFAFELENARAGRDRLTPAKPKEDPFSCMALSAIFSRKDYYGRYDPILRQWYHIPYVSEERFRKWKADLAKKAEMMRVESKEAETARKQKHRAEKEQQLRDYCQRTGQNYEALIANQAAERQATMRPLPEVMDQFINQTDEYHKRIG